MANISFIFILFSLRNDCCPSNHWGCDSNNSHRHHYTSVQNKARKDGEQTRICVSAHNVYPTHPNHIIQSPPQAKLLIQIDHVRDPVETPYRLTYAVKMTMLEKHRVITCSASLESTNNVLNYLPTSYKKLNGL